jgi:hypothetical protein
LQQPLIWTWVTTPFGWILMHPKSASSFSMGEVVLPQVTDGYCRLSRHFPNNDVQAYGSLRVHENPFGWFAMHDQGKPRHLDHLRLDFTRLQEAGLRVNTPKLKFCAVETEYLGYILTWTSIKPQPIKVQVILTITPPKQVKGICRFLGMVHYYRDHWARCSELLAPLTSLIGECGQTKVTRAKKTKKRAWHWDEMHQKAFDSVKAAIAKDLALAYTDYSKEFEISFDASSKQLGAVVTQGNRPITLFSRKLA